MPRITVVPPDLLPLAGPPRSGGRWTGRWQHSQLGSTEPLMRGGVPGCPAQSQLCWGGAKTGRGRVPGHREALQPQGPSRRPLQEQRALRTQGRSVGFHGEVGRVAGQPGAPA